MEDILLFFIFLFITFIIFIIIYFIYNYNNLYLIDKFTNNNCNNYIKHENSYCYPGVEGTLMEKNKLNEKCKSKDKCKGYILYNKGNNINKGYLCRDNWSGTLNNYDKTDTYECQTNCECPEGYTQIKCDPKTGIAICKPPIDNKIQELKNIINTNKTNLENNMSTNIINLENKINKNKNIVYITKNITTITSNYNYYPASYFYIDDVQYNMEDIPEILNSNAMIIKYLVENNNNKIIIDINNLKTYNNNNILQKRLKINYNLHRDMNTYWNYVSTLTYSSSAQFKINNFSIGTILSYIYIDFYSDPNYNSGNWYFSVRYKTTRDNQLLPLAKYYYSNFYSLGFEYNVTKTVGKFGEDTSNRNTSNTFNKVYYKLNVTETENWNVDYGTGGKTEKNNYTILPNGHNNKFNNGTEIYYNNIGGAEFNLLFKFVNNKLIISMIPYLGEYSIIIKGL